MVSFFKGLNSAFDINGSSYVKRKQDNTLLLALLIRNNASLRIINNISKVANKLNTNKQFINKIYSLLLCSFYNIFQMGLN